jgi:aspartate aminotransferase
MTGDPGFQHEINLNLNIRSLSPSATLVINERSNQLMREGRKIYKLGLGQSPFPVPDPVVKALQENAFQKDYLPVKGLPALREAICGFYGRHAGVQHDPEYTIIGPGSKELLFFIAIGVLWRIGNTYPKLGKLCPAGAYYWPQYSLGSYPERK